MSITFLKKVVIFYAPYYEGVILLYDGRYGKRTGVFTQVQRYMSSYTETSLLNPIKTLLVKYKNSFLPYRFKHQSPI